MSNEIFNNYGKKKLNIFFKNIRLVSPSQNIDETTNLWVRDGIIAHCSPVDAILDQDTEIIDSDGWVAAPGFFDMHVHFRDPGQEHKENIKTGSMAAANGGFTGVCTMPNTDPAVDNIAVVEYILNRSRGSIVDVYPSGAITQNREGKMLSPMFEMHESGAIMFTDDGTCLTDSLIMRRAFDYAKTRDLLLSQHCEDHRLTDHFAANESRISANLGLKGYPSVAEEIMLSRDINLAEYCGNCRYHAQHISTKGAVEHIRNAKQKGLRVSAEVTPHHFSLTDEELNSYNTDLKMNPPLRTKEDIEAIVEGIKDGTIDCIASDHAPHTLHEKEVEFEHAPYGIIGLETTLGVAITYLHLLNNIPLNRLIQCLSVNPRKILKINDLIIKVNEPANLTIFSINEKWFVDTNKFLSKSRNTPFKNMGLYGLPKYIINNNMLHKSILLG